MREPCAQAHRLVSELVANGARFTYRPSSGAMPPSFIYELEPSGDRRRCRQIIAEAKADPLLWAAVLKRVAEQSEAAP